MKDPNSTTPLRHLYLYGATESGTGFPVQAMGTSTDGLIRFLVEGVWFKVGVIKQQPGKENKHNLVLVEDFDDRESNPLVSRLTN
jgi:hypothetical protein